MNSIEKKKRVRGNYSLFFMDQKLWQEKGSNSRFEMHESTYLFQFRRTEYFIIDVTSCGSLEYK